MRAIEKDLVGSSQKAYFIGIGGVGMSALARVLKHRGLRVAGSDARESRTVRALNAEGIQVQIGQNEFRDQDADLFVYSSAIAGENFQLKQARACGKKVFHRAEILASLLNQAKTSVAITGTHGKTTTSSMISFVLTELGRRPTCLVGGDVLNFDTNTLLGDPDLWVSEVDESDQTHELYAPNYAIITNLEEDHMDHYRDRAHLELSFRNFLSNMRNPGLVVYFGGDSGVTRIVQESGKPAVSFGFTPENDFSAGEISLDGFGSEFDLYEEGFFVTRMKLSVPGRHNIANALAATAVLTQLGVDIEDIQKVLVHFRGARRRLEIKWKSDSLMVIDDYAHHPTEVKASVSALKNLGKHLTVIFQPHRFSRTQYFIKDFAKAFEGADELILTDIYAAGEANRDNVSVCSIYEEILQSEHLPVHMMTKKEIIPYLMRGRGPEGIVAFLGAGDIGEVADEFALRAKSPAQV